MMPIPLRFLRENVMVLVCTETDQYQNPVYGKSYSVRRCRTELRADVSKTTENTTLSHAGTLFIDAWHTSPDLDWLKLLETAQAAGGDLIVVTEDNTRYPVLQAKRYNADGRLHHWEISLGWLNGSSR